MKEVEAIVRERHGGQLPDEVLPLLSVSAFVAGILKAAEDGGRCEVRFAPEDDGAPRLRLVHGG